MTTKEFRSDPKLVAQMRAVLEMDIMKLWLAALERDNPANFRVLPSGSPHYMHVQLGEQTGYGLFKSRFMLGGEGVEETTDDRGPQDYSRPTEEETEQE